MPPTTTASLALLLSASCCLAAQMAHELDLGFSPPLLPPLRAYHQLHENGADSVASNDDNGSADAGGGDDQDLEEARMPTKNSIVR